MVEKSKILIVDDKQENLFAIKETLKEVDVDIILASSGNEALKNTLHHEFALIILDVQMPEMDGYELAELLRSEKQTRQIPLMFLSAVYSSEYSVMKGFKTGAIDFLTKPINPKILINKVKVFVQLDQQKKELQDSLSKVKLLSGLLPVCSSCNKVRDDKGYWNTLESYIAHHSEAELTHEICPDCKKMLYPELNDENEDTGNQQSKD